jgi:hypothetical protein
VASALPFKIHTLGCRRIRARCSNRSTRTFPRRKIVPHAAFLDLRARPKPRSRPRRHQGVRHLLDGRKMAKTVTLLLFHRARHWHRSLSESVKQKERDDDWAKKDIAHQTDVLVPRTLSLPWHEKRYHITQSSHHFPFASILIPVFFMLFLICRLPLSSCDTYLSHHLRHPPLLAIHTPHIQLTRVTICCLFAIYTSLRAHSLAYLACP